MTNFEDRMTQELGCSPEPCAKCGVQVWADDEIGCYVDIRMATGSYGETEYLYCTDGEGHTV